MVRKQGRKKTNTTFSSQSDYIALNDTNQHRSHGGKGRGGRGRGRGGGVGGNRGRGRGRPRHPGAIQSNEPGLVTQIISAMQDQSGTEQYRTIQMRSTNRRRTGPVPTHHKRPIGRRDDLEEAGIFLDDDDIDIDSILLDDDDEYDDDDDYLKNILEELSLNGQDKDEQTLIPSSTKLEQFIQDNAFLAQLDTSEDPFIYQDEDEDSEEDSEDSSDDSVDNFRGLFGCRVRNKHLTK
ncbi:hypothetical protein BDF19DRAFT_243169 [Syncephalis fuscata]|nr:hypothetical protein BDF19DRAFT_243169 [Syncephalis fuscata]